MFAEPYPRDKDNYIKFPSDTKYRQLHFPSDIKHPAKANLYLVEELIKYTSEPNDYVMDIMAGSGSLLIGLFHNRNIIAIEINGNYSKYIEEAASNITKAIVSNHKYVTITADCKDVLPIPVQSIIFSPPYADMLHPGKGLLARDKMGDTTLENVMHEYQAGDLASMKPFLYNKKMMEVYKLCYDSLESGGYLSLIIKDKISKQLKVELGLEAFKMMDKVGFVLDTWEKWKPRGFMFNLIKQKKGERVVLDEHIIVMRRP